MSTKDSQGTIDSDSSSIVFTPSGFHLTGKIALKQASPTRVELEGLLGNGSYIARDVDDADLTSKFSLEFNGNVLTIKMGGAMLGKGASYRYIRTIDGCWFIDPQGITHDISLLDGTITVRKNGKLERSYKILPTD